MCGMKIHLNCVYIVWKTSILTVLAYKMLACRLSLSLFPPVGSIHVHNWHNVSLPVKFIDILTKFEFSQPSQHHCNSVAEVTKHNTS